VEYKTLNYEQKDAIGILTLNRPKCLNAINDEMAEELEGFWMEKMYDLDTRVIILTGAGDRAFCAGLDMKEAPQELVNLGSGAIYQFQTRISRLLLLMRHVPQPIICAIHGYALGGGLSFALGGDVRIITPEAKFAATYINIGLGGADVGSSYLLPRQIGTGRAYEFLLTGDFMDADEALKLGFVSRVVSYDDLMPTAMEMAQKMVSKSPLGLRLTKEAINQNIGAAGLEQALQMENRNQTLCIFANKMEKPSPISR